MNYRLNGQRQKECIGRERQTDRQTDRETDRQKESQRELKSEGVIGREIVPLGKKEIMNYRLEWKETERMYRT